MELPVRSDLLRDLTALCKEEFEEFKDKLGEVLLEQGSELVSITPADPAVLTDHLIRLCRGDSKTVDKVLADVNARLRRAEKQARKEDLPGNSWVTDTCKLCPREEDPPEEVQPEIVQDPDGKQEMYSLWKCPTMPIKATLVFWRCHTCQFPCSNRIHFSGSGSYRCSETKLGFEVSAAVTIQYRYGFWDQRLGAWNTHKWMIAGPLFNILAEPAMAVAAIHLPHFVCLRGTDCSRMHIAHFIEEGMTLEAPMRVMSFHAVLRNPSFSLYGVVWGIRSKSPALIHSIVLLYWAFKMAKMTLHLYIIPNDHSRVKAIDNYEKTCPSRLVPTSLQAHKPLCFDSHYIVSSQSNVEVTPKELEFCNIQAECLQSYVEIYTKDIRGGLELSLVESINKESIWDAHVRAEEVTLSVSSTQTQTDEHFVDQHREQLIQRVTAVDGILDSLTGLVLDLEQIQSIRSESSSMARMWKLYELVPKWDSDSKDRLYQVLKEKHRPLVEELEGI